LWTFDERRGGSRPKTEETGSKIDYEKLYAFCLDADVRSALSLIRQYDSSSLSEKDRAFKSQFESRFGFELDKSSYMSERKSQLDDILGLYRDYWRLSLLSPDQDFNAVIKKNVSKFLSEKYGLAQTGGEYLDDEILYEYLKKHVQALGYKTTGFIKCQEGLNLSRKRPRRHVSGSRRMARPEVRRSNACWSIDFVVDSLFNGHRFRALTIVDNYSRECLAIEAGQSMTGAEVAAVVERLVVKRGAPVDGGCPREDRKMAAGLQRVSATQLAGGLDSTAVR